MDLISVIVPAYKVEPFIDKCISSLVCQTYSRLEIILVDDGSPDRTGEICDSWAEKDNRIKVIHQNNMGGGAARNVALDIAQGNLIAFVDGDDYISKEMYEHLYSLIEKEADIAECNYLNVYDDFALFEEKEYKISVHAVQDALKANIEDRIFKQVIWNKLYRREAIGSIRFPVGTKIDDEFFTYKVLGNAKRLIHSDKICYAYRQQRDSVMHSISAEKRLQAVDAKVQRFEYIKCNYPDLENLCLIDLWFTCIYQGQMALLELENKDAQSVIEYLIGVIAEYPINDSKLSGKEKIWVRLAKRTLKFTCWIRNKLHIGV